jgi:hypothetical protein
MKTSDFIGEVRHIPIEAIQPTPDNPRGVVEKDESFERLVASIANVGILVPLVVTPLSKSHSGIKYELVDGERRFRAAKELGKKTVPAHVLHGSTVPRELRMLMFHLHMTREQWGAMAQCRSLVDAYPQLKKGVAFDEKAEWTKRIAEEAGMPSVTARDRVHVLAWPEPLKEAFFRFDEEQPKRNIYSYILALEASIIEPSRAAFSDFYNGSRTTDEAANDVRALLLAKTVDGIETGSLGSREQIRSIASLFSSELSQKQRKIALRIFRDFLNRREVQFEDVKAEITTRLPELLEEKPPKPERILAAIVALTRTLDDYDVSFIDASAKTDSKRKRLKEDFRDALAGLTTAAKSLQSDL